MTTAKWVFEKAMSLMDSLAEGSGIADIADNTEYKNRTISILNILRMECFPFSDTYQVTAPGKRPVCPEIVSLEDKIPLDDALAQGVLPYGLAAHLLVDENPDSASFFNQRYEQLLNAMKVGLPATEGDITDVYGIIEHDSFGRW
jgi:hypothetical protein